MPFPSPSVVIPWTFTRFGLWISAGILSSVVTLSTAGTLRADEWTDVSGLHTLNADFLGIWGDQAVFAMPNGQRKAVLLKNLQAESRLRALDLAEQRKAHVEDVKSELESLKAAERAPSPKEVEAPSQSAPEYQSLAEGATLQETLDHTLQQLRAGHPRVLWDLLPKSYQQDVESLVVEFGGKMDPNVWNQQIATIERVTHLMASREEWIFSHPQVSAMISGLSNDEASARANYRDLIGLFQSIADPEKISLERLQKGDLGSLIVELDKSAAGYLQPFTPLLDESLPTSITAKMVDDTHGSFTVQQAGMLQAPAPSGGAMAQSATMMQSSTMTQSTATGPSSAMMEVPTMQPSQGPQAAAAQGTKMIQVEGRWVPESMAETWEKDVEQARTQIAQLATTIQQYRFMIDAVGQWVNLNLSPLESAETRSEFHAGIDPIVQFAAQWIGRPRASNNPNSAVYGSGSGYEATMANPMEAPGTQSTENSADYMRIP